ncbi:MAG TPA: (2Fe-2S)-binding protein [Ilumatobacteraceae bacterium]|nr:(2Fe-2S)-binding protein [Ilumatobacteraceae bacterium]
MTVDPTAIVDVRLTVNSAVRQATVPARTTAAGLLRDHLGLTGTHTACEHGVCGSCTILVDGASARSCLMFAAQLDGCAVTTVEGLATDGELNDLQSACLETHAFQCGFCTPGVLIVATELLAQNPSADEAEIREGLAGNACRCTGYESIVEAVLRARR